MLGQSARDKPILQFGPDAELLRREFQRRCFVRCMDDTEHDKPGRIREMFQDLSAFSFFGMFWR